MGLRISPGMIKKLWNVLRITVVMIRKLLVSKRKLITGMNMIVKRRNLIRKSLVSKRKLITGMNMIVKRRNLIRRTLCNLIRHHSREEDVLARGGYGLRDYEFSCSNSPNPVFSHAPSKQRISVIPCMNLSHVIEGIKEEQEGVDDRYYDEKAAGVPKTPDYFDEKLSPLLTYSSSPFSVMICDYSTEDDCEDEGGNGGKVDDEAEEFIRRFREQLWMQNRMQLLQH